eukprot:TRINITY_DN9171_c0_g1_i2.p1 TRINITY_DN9171_c0_g1~~TRINITY_DN9171_c0_g1_i2.p1  ORF type:complete len:158 (-),score=20.07 TRINITY_DN9171_c0_g1_i2:43-516(-)
MAESFVDEFGTVVLSTFVGALCSSEMDFYLSCKEKNAETRSHRPCEPQARSLLICRDEAQTLAIQKCEYAYQPFYTCLNTQYRNAYCRDEQEIWNMCIKSNFGVDLEREWQRKFFHNNNVNYDYHKFTPTTNKPNNKAYTHYQPEEVDPRTLKSPTK